MIVHTTCVIPHKDGTHEHYEVTADVVAIDRADGYRSVEVGEPEIEHSTGIPVDFDPFCKDSPFEAGWSEDVEDAITLAFWEMCDVSDLDPPSEEY